MAASGAWLRRQGAAAVVTFLAMLLLEGCAAPGRRLAADLPATLPPVVELAGTPFFPQRRYQCGPAALATVLAASGVPVVPDDVVDEVYLPARNGSLQAEIVAATRQRDRLAYLLAPSLGSLLEQVAAGRPVLVLQKTGGGPWPGWHYAVVVGYDLARERLLLRSGTEARLELPLERFMAGWDRADRWALLVLRPGELPAAADLPRFMAAAAGLEAVGRREAAALAYRAATQAWPDQPLPRLGLGNLAYASGDLARADEELRAAASRAPDDVVIRNNRAVVLLAMGCPASARREAGAAAARAAGGAHAAAVAATWREVEAAGASDAPGCPADGAWAHSPP
jgi:hypothetical protein